MKPFVLLVALATPWRALGEGLPLDEKGNLESPHTVVELNESQQEEAVTLDSVTLTAEQWKALRKVSPDTPKRLQGLIPITYRDCLCGEQMGAVQLSANRIAVLHEDQSSESLMWQIQQAPSLTFRVDNRGQFYLKGVLTQFPKLLEAIERSKPYEAKERPAPVGDYEMPGWVNIEVPMGMSATDAVFQDRINRVYDALARKGWNSARNLPKPDVSH
jgi:hypothetical protein